MKKILCFSMVLILIVSLITGCSAEKTMPENDILNYERLDPDKVTLYIGMLGNNVYIQNLAEAFEKENPDIQTICIDITGGNSEYRPVVEWVTHGIAPDVLFVNPDTFTDNAIIEEYLEDLSANPVVENFDTESLDRTAVDGRVYFLPSPSEINCMSYNKTLFEQYGWDVPKTFDEFVVLCNQIKTDTNGKVQPWNPNAKYENVFLTALEGFAYEEMFGGAENRGWYNDFCAGNASYSEHMKPFYDMVQKLIDNNIILEEHFTYSATTRGKEFNNGSIAMINVPVSSPLRGESASKGEYEFGFAPYPTTLGDSGYVNDYFSSLMCIPKSKRTSEKQEAIGKYIEFLGSVEGQKALIGNSLMVSNVKGVPLNESASLAEINDIIKKGNKFNRLDFTGETEKNWLFTDDILKMTTGEKTGEEIIAEIDKKPFKTVEESYMEASPKVAEVVQDLSILEFSCYIADMYREKADADIGLINHGVAYRGNLLRLFEGDILESYVTVLKPRSFDNNSTLIKVSMTGQQLIDALNHPMGNAAVSDSVYACSGLKCEIAPWNELGSKYLSVKLSDGSEVDLGKLYTVAIWDGTVGEEYITERLQSYEGTWEELMTAKMKTDGTIAPAKDARTKLVWE